VTKVLGPPAPENKAGSQGSQEQQVEKDGFDDISGFRKIFKRRPFFFPQLLTDQM